MLPTFIVIGAAKCATTSVCELLGDHPDVFMSDPKEPHYFQLPDSNAFEERRAWYESLFRGAEGAGAVGEGSVSCTHPTRLGIAPPRIRRLIPDCKLVYMVRHPIRRIESDWRMMRHEGRTSGSIRQAFDDDPALLAWGHYWNQLGAYRSLFRDEQILVVFFEDFVRSPREEMRRIYAHVGVDPDHEASDAHRPRMASKDLYQFGRATARLRDSFVFRKLRPLLPRAAVELGKRLLGRPEHHEAAWDAATLRMVVELYREGTKLLLEYCGKPADFWELGATSPPPERSDRHGEVAPVSVRAPKRTKPRRSPRGRAGFRS
jgi:hypothetical protein